MPAKSETQLTVTALASTLGWDVGVPNARGEIPMTRAAADGTRVRTRVTRHNLDVMSPQDLRERAHKELHGRARQQYTGFHEDAHNLKDVMNTVTSWLA